MNSSLLAGIQLEGYQCNHSHSIRARTHREIGSSNRIRSSVLILSTPPKVRVQFHSEIRWWNFQWILDFQVCKMLLNTFIPLQWLVWHRMNEWWHHPESEPESIQSISFNNEPRSTVIDGYLITVNLLPSRWQNESPLIQLIKIFSSVEDQADL